MFGFFRKAPRVEETLDRQKQWEESPTIPIVEPISNKVAYLLANRGRQVVVNHRGDLCRIVPLAIFRKPAYGRTYVQVQVEGADQPTALNLSDIKLPPEATVRLARKPLDLTPGAPTSVWGTLGLVLVLLCIVGGAAVFFSNDGAARLGELGLNPWGAPAEEAAPTASTASSPSASEPAPTHSADEAAADPALTPEIAPTEPTSSASPLQTAADTPTTFGRVFTSKVGSTLRAEFVEFRFQGSRVVLQKPDGETIDISMNDLSREDQQWIRDELKRRKADREAMP